MVVGPTGDPSLDPRQGLRVGFLVPCRPESNLLLSLECRSTGSNLSLGWLGSWPSSPHKSPQIPRDSPFLCCSIRPLSLVRLSSTFDHHLLFGRPLDIRKCIASFSLLYLRRAAIFHRSGIGHGVPPWMDGAASFCYSATATVSHSNTPIQRGKTCHAILGHSMHRCQVERSSDG